MNTEEINKYGMYLVVIKFLAGFSVLIATIPALVRYIASFTKLVTDIETKSKAVSGGTSSKTDAKRQTELGMTNKVVTLVGKLHAYAANKKNVELMADSHLVDSDIRNMRDAGRAEFAKKKVELVESHKAELVDHGVTDQGIATAYASIDAYSESLGNRETAKKGQTGGKDMLAQMFVDADFLLVEQIDPLIRGFKKDNPEFCASYDAARVIKDIAAHRKGKDGGNTGDVKPPEK